MNFLGILKGAVHGTAVAATYGAGIISLFNPALGELINRISGKVASVEAALPEDKRGPEKHALVVDDFNGGLAMAQALLKASGRLMTYDGTLLDKAIAAEVAKNNAFAEFAKSIKIVDTSAKSPTIIGA